MRRRFISLFSWSYNIALIIRFRIITPSAKKKERKRESL